MFRDSSRLWRGAMPRKGATQLTITGIIDTGIIDFLVAIRPTRGIGALRNQQLAASEGVRIGLVRNNSRISRAANLVGLRGFS